MGLGLALALGHSIIETVGLILLEEFLEIVPILEAHELWILPSPLLSGLLKEHPRMLLPINRGYQDDGLGLVLLLRFLVATEYPCQWLPEVLLNRF